MRGLNSSPCDWCSPGATAAATNTKRTESSNVSCSRRVRAGAPDWQAVLLQSQSFCASTLLSKGLPRSPHSPAPPGHHGVLRLMQGTKLGGLAPRRCLLLRSHVIG